MAPIDVFTIFFMTAAFAQSPDLQVDMHLDTPTQLLTKGLHMDAEQGLEAGLDQLRAGGTNVAVEVLWPPRKGDHKKRAFALLETMEREFARSPGVTLAREPEEVRAAVSRGSVAILLSMEGAHGLGVEADWQAVLREFYDRGLRLLGLTWSFSNRFAGSSSDQGGGLTEEGTALVALARELRIVLDVSHASRDTTLAVCKSSTVPVIASHSDVYALKAHARNLSDEEIRCIAGTGGVIGLNFHATFVGGTMDISAVADHADHLARIGGHAVVALGSDFDGYIKKPAGLEDAGSIPALWAELERRGWTEAQIRGAKGENFMAAWQRVRTP